MDCINKLISIIVPVYNTDKYLSRCFDSVLTQTYPFIELIIIDDGSSDSSGDICKSYASHHQNISYIRINHSGLSFARNTGINNSKGEYLFFLDSDDFIQKNTIEILYYILKSTNSDICMGEIEKGNNNKFNIDTSNIILNNINYSEFNNCIDLLYNELFREKIVISCNKLFRKNIFNDLRYPVNRIHEDEFVILNILNQCNKITIVHLPLYYQYENNYSITRSKYNLKRLDVLDAIEIRCDFFNNNNDIQNYILSNKDYLRRSQYHYVSIKKYYPANTDILILLKKKYIYHLNEIYNNLTLFEKMRYKFFLISPLANELLKTIGKKIIGLIHN